MNKFDEQWEKKMIKTLDYKRQMRNTFTYLLSGRIIRILLSQSVVFSNIWLIYIQFIALYCCPRVMALRLVYVQYKTKI